MMSRYLLVDLWSVRKTQLPLMDELGLLLELVSAIGYLLH